MNTAELLIEGYGRIADEVGSVLDGLGDADDRMLTFHERSVEYLGGLADHDLDRVIDRNWDPPVTLAVRLVSVLSDCLQHVGQAAYVRGLVERSASAGR